MEFDKGDFKLDIADSCVLCDIYKNETSAPIRSLFSPKEIKREILYEDDLFFIIADIGPVFDCHYLVNYKGHIPSFSYLTTNEFHKLSELKSRLKSSLSRKFGKITFFEHGAKSFSRSGGACIDHAHIHVVPIGFDILDRLSLDYTFELKDKEYVMSLKGKKEYLYYEYDDNMYLSQIEGDKVPTQYFRRILSNLHSYYKLWNWRDFVKYPDIFNTRERILKSRNTFLHFFYSTANE